MTVDNRKRNNITKRDRERIYWDGKGKIFYFMYNFLHMSLFLQPSMIKIIFFYNQKIFAPRIIIPLYQVNAGQRKEKGGKKQNYIC
jgi:hypothetical protein